VLRSKLKTSTHFSAVFFVLALLASPALAQEGGGDDDAANQPAANQPAPPTPEQQKEATALFTEGQKLAGEKKYTEAIEKFEAAYKIYPDPALRFVIGEAFQLLGNEGPNYEYFRKAVESYKKYVELVPEGKLTDTANERIGTLEEAIAAEEQRIADEKAQAEKEKQDEAEAARKAEEERKRKLLERQEMQIAFGGNVLAGSDLELSAYLRMLGGAFLTWEHVALEARLGIDGMLRVDNDQGLSTNSFTLLDLGARWGANYHFVGPFVSGGASFGLFWGKPRERKVMDSETCAGFENNTCPFDIDKNIVTRLAFGYGFSASERTTVAVRLETQLWFLSVDDEQGIGNPRAADVTKPQTTFAFLLGLEFLRWM
jgi:hypothetical protein